MARHNNLISVTFNDNSGAAGYSVYPESVRDLKRYQRIFGVWRTRWILFKWFYRGLMQAESMANQLIEEKDSLKKWIINAEIPE